MFRRSFLGTAAAFALVAVTATAPMADDTAILTVTTGEMQHSYTLADLQALPMTEFQTETIWTEGPQTFQGVALTDLLSDITANGGQTGKEIKATAVNDYSVTIPLTDAVDGGPIVAYLQNGQEMSRRDKGPLWVVYPYDSRKSYQSETYFSRSIWQLDRMTIQ